MSATVTIGFTRPETATGIAFFDTYTPGDPQDTLAIELDITEADTPEGIAETIFEVSNLAQPGRRPHGQAIFDQIYGPIIRGEAPRIRSLSCGDTVTIDTGPLTVTVGCARYGWETITPALAC